MRLQNRETIMWGTTRSSALFKQLRLTLVRNTPLTLLCKTDSALQHYWDQLANPDKNFYRVNFYLHPIMPQARRREGIPTYSSFFKSETFSISSTESKIVCTAKPTFTFCITNGLEFDTVHTATCFLDTGAGMNPENHSLIHPSCRSRLKCKGRSEMGSAMRQTV